MASLRFLTAACENEAVGSHFGVRIRSLGNQSLNQSHHAWEYPFNSTISPAEAS
jgi:hypothetical protein